MEEIDRTWNKNFEKYTEFIVNHPNYKGLFYERENNGRVKWVVTGKSNNGQQRLVWWNKKCKDLNIPIQKGCYAIVARLIHPTGYHVCQCCGKKLSIRYEYPSKALMGKINQYFHLTLSSSDMSIGDIIDAYCTNQVQRDFISLCLHVPHFSDNSILKNYVYKELVDKNAGPLSPGVMSNSPDRFDGFHSDGLCCREKTDKGRHRDNMKTYTQDRRAYEEWADGDYNLANRLMGEFAKFDRKYICPKCGDFKQMSADHIGPISLGFSHSRWNFAPLCMNCNDAKNNRFTKEDITKLLELEGKGKQIISWHAQYIWDKLKNNVHDDIQAKELSSIMANCHKNVLHLFAQIYKECGSTFLRRYLHPEYSFVDYKFENFNPFDWTKLKIISTPLESKNKIKNSNRYIRIAFDSLEQFEEKNNRKVTFYVDHFEPQVRLLISTIQRGEFICADQLLKQLIVQLSEYVYKKHNESNIAF